MPDAPPNSASSLSARPFARAIAIAACLAGGALIAAPAPDGMDPAMMPVAGVVMIAVGLWATAAVPEYFTALIFFTLAVTVAGADRQVAFSGFYSSAVWMIFGGLILALAVRATGLGARIANVILARIGASYLGIVAGAVAVAALMAFIIPSNTARVMIALPIFLALADRLGFAQGSQGRAGIALAVGAGSVYPSLAILPSAVPNLVMVGAAESIYGARFTYGEYLLIHFPVLGLVMIVALPLVLTALYRDTPRAVNLAPAPAPITGAERRLLVVLGLTLGLWITDFAHGVSPAWVALGAALVCMAPRIGMLDPSVMVEKINYAPWFFVAGVIGMGAMVAQSGLGDVIGARLIALAGFTPGNDFRNLVALNVIGMAMGWIATVPGAPAIMTGIAGSVAAATGWPLMTAINAQVLSWAMSLFPYELPPMVLAMQLAGVRPGQALRLFAAVFVIAWTVVLPLQYLWWQTLGMFG